MTGTPLNREEIAALLERAPPLMANITDLEQQLQPNGFDLTVRAIAQFDSPGSWAETLPARNCRRPPSRPSGRTVGYGSNRVHSWSPSTRRSACRRT